MLLLLMVGFHLIFAPQDSIAFPSQRIPGGIAAIDQQSRISDFLVQPTFIQSADSRSSMSCRSDERASFCFSTSLTSEAVDVNEDANDCCRLRYMSVSRSTSTTIALSLHCLSQVCRNQNLSPSPLEGMAFAEVVCTA